eukprot:scaffold232602_cov46-Prasinocladus_malaysianus.AAC.1
MPTCALQKLKSVSARHLAPGGRVEDLPASATASCAFAAAASAATLTNPVDVVKTRLQVLAAGSGGESLNARQVALQIWRREGVVGFFSGCTARILSIAPEAAIQPTDLINRTYGYLMLRRLLSSSWIGVSDVLRHQLVSMHCGAERIE